MRLNHDAEKFEEITNYFFTRKIQVKGDGALFMGVDKKDFGAISCWLYQDKIYQSIYIKKSHRGSGIYQEIWKQNPYPILTTPDCLIEDYLIKKNIPYILLATHQKYPEYQMIQNHYGDGIAKRSGQPLMNHIDEGITVLKSINASEDAIKAYCLHPLFQGDEDLKKSFNTLDLCKISPSALALTLEYRSVANEYLSKREIKSISEIRLSPLTEVNQMLIADKVQNYKDFLLHHKGSHERGVELDQYFKNWFKVLSIDLSMMDLLK